MEKSIVLKIGGSILYDNNLNINAELLRKVKNWYYEVSAEYEKVVMVVGGGSLSRELQQKIATSVGGEEYLHNIGMSVTHTNAAILQGYIEDPNIYVPKKLGDAYEFLWEDSKRVIISGGLKVGWSTDMDSAVFADVLGIKKVLKLSNVSHVYEQDPAHNPNALPITNMSWDQYFDMFNILEDSVHKANNSIPIDIECARFSSQKGISFFISGGKSIYEKQNIRDILQEGTLIHP
jgi:predicted uridylate kinase